MYVTKLTSSRSSHVWYQTNISLDSIIKYIDSKRYSSGDTVCTHIFERSHEILDRKTILREQTKLLIRSTKNRSLKSGNDSLMTASFGGRERDQMRTIIFNNKLNTLHSYIQLTREAIQNSWISRLKYRTQLS